MRKSFLFACFLLFTEAVCSQSLKTFWAMTLENSPALRAAEQHYRAAQEALPQASALPDPQLQGGAFLRSAETRVGPKIFQLGASQAFPWFGTLTAAEEKAQHQAEAQAARKALTERQLRWQVARHYYNRFALAEKIRIEQENIKLLHTYKRVTESSFANGKGQMTDALRVEIRLEDARTRLAVLRQERLPEQIALNRLAGRPDSVPVRLPDSLPLRTAEKKDSAAALATHPRLQTLEAAQRAQKATETLARKKARPRFSVGLDYGFIAARNVPDLPEQGKDTWMPKVGLSVPIWGTKNRARIRQAQLEGEALKAEHAAETDRLRSQLAEAHFQRKQARLQKARAQAQIRTTQKTLDLLYTAYSTTGNNFEEVLRMQQKLLGYQKAAVEAEQQHRLAQARIDFLTAKTPKK